MNIIEATKALKEGKKIRRDWCNDNAFYCRSQDSDVIYDENNVKVEYSITELLANDWKVIEEKTPMQIAWDKAKSGVYTNTRGFFEAGWKAAESYFNTYH